MRPAMSPARRSSLPAEGGVSPAMMRKQRALAAARGAEQAQELAARHAEIDAVERGHAVAKGFADAPSDGERGCRHRYLRSFKPTP